MKQCYADWIAAHVHDAYGRCAQVTVDMQQHFPELTRVRGHYYCLSWGERAHWWLVDPEANIVDPTAKQFPSKGHGEYVPWTEGAVEPTGMCPNCGGYVYDHNTCCSDSCSRAFAADMGVQYGG